MLLLDPTTLESELEYILSEIRPNYLFIDGGFQSQMITECAFSTLEAYAIIQMKTDCTIPLESRKADESYSLLVDRRGRTNTSSSQARARDLSTLKPSMVAVIMAVSRGSDRSMPSFVYLQHQHITAAIRRVLKSYELTSSSRTLLRDPLFQSSGLLGQLLPTLACHGEYFCPFRITECTLRFRPGETYPS